MTSRFVLPPCDVTTSAGPFLCRVSDYQRFSRIDRVTSVYVTTLRGRGEAKITMSWVPGLLRIGKYAAV
jgi:hypothetical protein